MIIIRVDSTLIIAKGVFASDLTRRYNIHNMEGSNDLTLADSQICFPILKMSVLSRVIRPLLGGFSRFS